jgi:hypothetical protein
MPFHHTCVRCGKVFVRSARITPLNKPFMYCSMACQHPVRAGIPQDDGTVLVPLSQGKFAIIDAGDANRVLGFNWSYRQHRGREYAIRALPGGRRNVFMHVELMGPLPDGFEVDHIDGNGLNNRRNNMREATRHQNMHNARGRRVSRSGYKGVSLNACSGRWIARIFLEGRQRSLGCYDTAEEAARAYDAAAREAWGEFAFANFKHD